MTTEPHPTTTRRGMVTAAGALGVAATALVAPRPAPAATTTPALPYVSVAEFGALGDGLANDTDAVRKALDAAKDGGTVFFPRGVYSLDPFAVTRDSVTLAGEGRLASVLSFRNGTGSCIEIRPPVPYASITRSTPPVRGCGLRDIMVRSTPDHVGAVVRLRKADRAVVEDVHVRGGEDGIVGDYGVSELVLDKVWIDQHSDGRLRYGVHLKRDCVATGISQLAVVDGGYGVRAGSAGLVCDTGLDTLVASQVEIIGPAIGVWVRHVTALSGPPGQGDENNMAPRWLRFYGTVIETANNDNGIFVEEKSGASGILDRPTDVTFHGAHVQRARTGVRIKGGLHLVFDGVNVVNNRMHGFDITGGGSIKVAGCLIANNSQSQDRKYDGVAIGPGIKGGIRIDGNTIGNVYPPSAPSGQRYGVLVADGSTDYVELTGNDLRQNRVRGFYKGVGAGANVRSSGNWGA